MCRLIQSRTNTLSILVLNVALFQTLQVIQYVEFKDVQTAVCQKKRGVYVDYIVSSDSLLILFIVYKPV